MVVSDRYSPSTFAYQGYGRGLDLSVIRQTNLKASGSLKPDLVVLLDIDPESGLKRKSPETYDRIERESHEFHRRIRDGYLS